MVSTPETACGAVTRVECASATEFPVHRPGDRRLDRIIAAASGYFVDPPLNRMVVVSSANPHTRRRVCLTPICACTDAVWADHQLGLSLQFALLFSS